MAKFFLIRHGESEYNRLQKFTGLHNPDLTRLGKEQAVIAASKVKNVKFKHAFTSELTRAKDTYSVIDSVLGLNLTVKVEKLLNERDYGEYSGKLKKHVINSIGEDEYLKFKHQKDIRIPGGESLQDVENRIVKFLNRNAAEFSTDQNILVICHNNVIRVMYAYLSKMTFEEFVSLKINSGEVYELDYSPR